MRQVDDLHKTFIGSGWLQQQCANFNTEHELLVGILGMGSIMHHDHFQITASQVCSSQAKPQIYQILWSEKFSTYLGRGGLQSSMSASQAADPRRQDVRALLANSVVDYVTHYVCTCPSCHFSAPPAKLLK